MFAKPLTTRQAEQIRRDLWALKARQELTTDRPNEDWFRRSYPGSPVGTW